MAEPRGRKRKFTDADLRADIDAGLSPAKIAEKYHVSRQAVHERIRQLEQTTAGAAAAIAVTAPEESRQAASSLLDLILSRLNDLMQTMELLKASCEAELRDPVHPDRFNWCPRAHEIEVIYSQTDEDGVIVSRGKMTLQELLGKAEHKFIVDRVTSKYSDPREGMVKIVAECRQLITAAVSLAEKLTSARAMEVTRQELVALMKEVEPDLARQFVTRIRSRLVLYTAAGGSGGVS
jgi:predicted DNA-binding protein YlxM (UPF0122 family)